MILCCGEALIDMLPAPEAAGPPAWSAHVGGAIFNTAVALGRLGAPTGLMTGLSTDAFGSMLRAQLDAAEVDHSNSVTTRRKTALAFVTLTGGQAEYSFHDAGSAHRELELPADASLPDDVRALFVGGISLASEPCGTKLEALASQAGSNRLLMLDPNIRPAFIEDEAEYRARLDRMIRQADIVKVSDEDLAWLLQDRGPLSDQVDQVLAMGPSIVIATQGAKGALSVARAGFRVSVQAPEVSVVDTVGAGDTFNAGFLAKLHQLGLLDLSKTSTCTREDLRTAIAYGVSAAAFVVARAGADPPWHNDLVK